MTSTFFNVFLFMFPSITNAGKWFLKEKSCSDGFVPFVHPFFFLLTVLQFPFAKQTRIHPNDYFLKQVYIQSL